MQIECDCGGNVPLLPISPTRKSLSIRRPFPSWRLRAFSFEAGKTTAREPISRCQRRASH